VGFGRMLRTAVSDSDLGRRLAFSLLTCVLFVVAFALLRVTVSLPYYAQAKAFYVLSAVVPLSACAALGLAWIPERLSGPRWRPVRSLYAGWLTTLVGSIILSFLG